MITSAARRLNRSWSRKNEWGLIHSSLPLPLRQQPQHYHHSSPTTQQPGQKRRLGDHVGWNHGNISNNSRSGFESSSFRCYSSGGSIISNDGSLQTSWMNIYHDIVTTKTNDHGKKTPQRLTKTQWLQAVQFVLAMRLDQGDSTTTSITQEERLKYMFRVLNRLALELETTAASKPLPRLPGLEEGSLVALLVLYRNHVQNGEIAPRSMDDDDDDELSLRTIQKLIQRYIETGLFPPSNAYFNLLLQVVAAHLEASTTKDRDDFLAPHNSKIPQWAHDTIWQYMLMQKDTCHPDGATVYGMVELWAQVGEPQRALDYITQLEQWDSQYQTQGNSLEENPFLPIPNIYCALMEAYSRSKHYSPKDSRHEILDIWENKIQSTKLAHRDSTKLYARACHALAGCGQLDAAHNLLDDLCRRYEEDIVDNNISNDSELARHSLRPDRVLFTTLISAYGRAGRPQEAQRVFDTMDKMAQKNLLKDPDFLMYCELIWAYGRVGDTKSTKALLQRMIQTMEDDIDVEAAPSTRQEDVNNSDTTNTNSYQDWASAWNAVLVSWANSNDPHAPEYIRMMIKELEEMDRQNATKQNSGGKARQPLVTAYSYTILLHCYAQQGTIDSAKAAEELFAWMKQHQQKNDVTNDVSADEKHNASGNSMILDRNSYLNVILAWCRAGRPEKAEAHLENFCREVRENPNQHGIEPSSMTPPAPLLDVQHFTLILEAWAKSSNQSAATRATNVFGLMKEMNIAPNVVSYTSLLWAWAKTADKTRDSAGSIINIFQDMHHQWQDQGDEACKPNHIAYNALLSGLSRSSDPSALDTATKYFMQMEQMHDLKPSGFLYNTLMAAWSKRDRPDQTQALFDEMVQRYNNTRDPDLRPNSVVYRTLLRAWSKAGNPTQASAAMKDWIEAYQSRRIREAPSELEFSLVLQAWIKSSLDQAPDRAEQGLRQMMQFAQSGQFDCLPSVFTVTTVISAYARAAQTRPDAGQKAWDLFLLLEELGQIDQTLSNRTRGPKGRRRNGDEFEPNLLTGSQVIKALIHSPTPEVETRIQHVLETLFQVMRHRRGQKKSSSFRTELRSGHIFRNLKSSLKKSTLESRDDLIRLCHQIENVAE